MLEKAVPIGARQHPDNEYALRGMARTLARLGRGEEAREATRKHLGLRAASGTFFGRAGGNVFVQSRALLYGDLDQSVGTLIPSITGVTLYLDPLQLVSPRDFQ